MDWLRVDRTANFDPLVASAMVHYQFETLHPFHDGNGRLGRLLIVLQLYSTGTLSEPTLTVSPWFESRRNEYQDRLLAVSTRGDWNGWTAFFASGLAESATATRRKMLALVQVQAELKDIVRTSKLRADTAHALVDFAISQVAFTVREVEHGLHVSYGRANQLVDSLVTLGIVQPLNDETYNRRFSTRSAIRSEDDHSFVRSGETEGTTTPCRAHQ